MQGKGRRGAYGTCERYFMNLFHRVKWVFKSILHVSEWDWREDSRTLPFQLQRHSCQSKRRLWLHPEHQLVSLTQPPREQSRVFQEELSSTPLIIWAPNSVSRESWYRLTTTVHPAARAAPNFLVTIAWGKFHGVIMPHTPTGCLMTRFCTPLIIDGMTSP